MENEFYNKYCVELSQGRGRTGNGGTCLGGPIS